MLFELTFEPIVRRQTRVLCTLYLDFCVDHPRLQIDIVQLYARWNEACHSDKQVLWRNEKTKTTVILQTWLSSCAHYLSLNGQNGWANGLNGLNGVGKGTWEVALSLHLLRAHALPCQKSSSTSSFNNGLKISLTKWYLFVISSIIYPTLYISYLYTCYTPTPYLVSSHRRHLHLELNYLADFEKLTLVWDIIYQLSNFIFQLSLHLLAAHALLCQKSSSTSSSGFRL